MRPGYTVLTAKDGIEAMEIFARHQDEIRCVVSDVAMPRMNGWEILVALRKLSPGIPMILSSGYDEEQVLINDHPERPQAFLHKPHQKVELQTALAKAMEDSVGLELTVRKSGQGETSGFGVIYLAYRISFMVQTNLEEVPEHLTSNVYCSGSACGFRLCQVFRCGKIFFGNHQLKSISQN